MNKKQVLTDLKSQLELSEIENKLFLDTFIKYLVAKYNEDEAFELVNLGYFRIKKYKNEFLSENQFVVGLFYYGKQEYAEANEVNLGATKVFGYELDKVAALINSDLNTPLFSDFTGDVNKVYDEIKKHDIKKAIEFKLDHYFNPALRSTSPDSNNNQLSGSDPDFIFGTEPTDVHNQINTKKVSSGLLDKKDQTETYSNNQIEDILGWHLEEDEVQEEQVEPPVAELTDKNIPNRFEVIEDIEEIVKEEINYSTSEENLLNQDTQASESEDEVFPDEPLSEIQNEKFQEEDKTILNKKTFEIVSNLEESEDDDSDFSDIDDSPNVKPVELDNILDEYDIDNKVISFESIKKKTIIRQPVEDMPAKEDITNNDNIEQSSDEEDVAEDTISHYQSGESMKTPERKIITDAGIGKKIKKTKRESKIYFFLSFVLILIIFSLVYVKFWGIPVFLLPDEPIVNREYKLTASSMIERDYSVAVNFPYTNKDRERFEKSFSKGLNLDSLYSVGEISLLETDSINFRLYRPVDVKTQDQKQVTQKQETQKPIDQKQPDNKPKTEDKPKVEPNVKTERQTISARQIGENIFFDGSIYTVQASSWKDKTKANREVDRLKKNGFDAYIEESNLGSKGTWFRVRVGKFKDLNQAQQVLTQLRKFL